MNCIAMPAGIQSQKFRICINTILRKRGLYSLSIKILSCGVLTQVIKIRYKRTISRTFMHLIYVPKIPWKYNPKWIYIVTGYYWYLFFIFHEFFQYFKFNIATKQNKNNQKLYQFVDWRIITILWYLKKISQSRHTCACTDRGRDRVGTG